MKKKVIGIGIVLILTAILVFSVIRCTVGWKPFKYMKFDVLTPYSAVMHIDLVEMKRENVPAMYFVKMLKEMQVTPYEGDYDPWSMTYFVYRESGTPLKFMRIGFALEPEPIIEIEGKVYRINRKSAEIYRNFWDAYNGEGYYGGWSAK